MTGPRTLALSVVIATRDRPELLRRSLAALLTQDFDPTAYEIVVVDDGTDPRTRQTVEQLQEQTHGLPALRYLAPAAHRGPAAARNRGWRAASGEVIAFTDDDTIANPAWLAEGMRALTPDVAAVAGRIVVPLPQRPTDYERDAAQLQHAEFATANCFVRRSDLAALEGFDERFTSAWREDSDLHFRLLECSLPVKRVDTAVVVHPVRPAGWGVSLRQQRKVLFDALLYRKHPELYRRRIRARPRWGYYAIVGLLAAAAVAALAGWSTAAAVALGAWALLTLLFFLKRLRGTSLAPLHVAEMLVTSIAIPPLAMFWRIVGWLRFRVLLL